MKNDPFQSVESQLGVFSAAYDEKVTTHDHSFCKMIATKVQESDFPADCQRFADCVSILKGHNSNSSQNPYAGMSPFDAADAKRAKDEGHLNNAQIKRRMTTKKNGRFY